MPPLIDITGQTFGRLTVLRRGTNTKRGFCRWLCLCSCGVQKDIYGSCLRKGQTKSCGCWQKEAGRIRGFKNRRHGKYIWSTPENRAYRSAKSRCENKNDNSYIHYGARGIKFLFNSFEEFFADVGRRPNRKGIQFSLDRIDSNGHYEPGNLRWATARQQCENRRVFKSIERYTTKELKDELRRRGESV